MLNIETSPTRRTLPGPGAALPSSHLADILLRLYAPLHLYILIRLDILLYLHILLRLDLLFRFDISLRLNVLLLSDLDEVVSAMVDMGTDFAVEQIPLIIVIVRGG